MHIHIYRLAVLFFCALPFVGQAQDDAEWLQLVNKKQYATIVDKAGSLTEADSANYQVMYAIGQAYEGLLRYRDAYGYFAQCYSMDTTNAELLNTLARTAINSGKGKEAEMLFLKMINADSLNFYANYQLGRLYYQTGEYEKAIANYSCLIAHNAGNATLHAALGDCYAKMELDFQATSNYYLAYNSNRENAGLANTLINSMLRMSAEYAEEALAICDTALYYSPGNRALLRNKGMTLFICKRFEEADTLYTSLMEQGDSTYVTLKYGGISRYQAGQYMRAVDPLEAAFEKDTTSIDVCLFLGSTLGKTFDRQRAFWLLDKAETCMQPPAAYLTQLKAFRAETYKNDRQYGIAEKLYYELWLNNSGRLDYLGHIDQLYSPNFANIKSETEQQKALFIKVLYARKAIEKDMNAEFLFFRRQALEKIYNDLFFRQITTMTMLAPDGKKSTISVTDIHSLMNELPAEMPK